MRARRRDNAGQASSLSGARCVEGFPDICPRSIQHRQAGCLSCIVPPRTRCGIVPIHLRASWLARLLWTAVICALSIARVCAEDAGPTPPDRRELWVPMDKLGHVLDEKAVLLSREQYDALLRDAGLDRPVKMDAPVGAALSSANIRAVLEGKTVSIHAELSVNVLRDGWCEVALEFPGAEIGEVRTKQTNESEVVLMPKNAALRSDAPPGKGKPQGAPKHPMMLLLRGRGEHRVTIALTARIASSDGVNAFALTVPNVASGTFTLALPAGATMEKAERAMKVSATAEATKASLPLSPATRSVAFAWKNAAAGNDAQVPMRAEAKVRYGIDAEKLAGDMLIRIESALGDLPSSFEFSVPPEVKVLSVHAEELRGWEASGGKVTVNFQDGARTAVEIEIATELPALAGKDAATVALPLPILAKVTRFHGALFLAGSEDVIVKEIAGDAALRRVATAEDRGEREFFGAYEFSGRAAAPRVAVERALPRMEADLDTLAEFRTDAIFLTRTITLREQKGRRFSAAIVLPPGEELLDVRRMEDAAKESEPEWTQEAGRVLIKWSDESAKPRVFRLRSRVEPEKWTQLPADGVTFTLGDAKIADAAKVAGYVALIADPAFRLEAQPGEMLERRDGRSTPVQGDYAWFRRDAFDLKVKIARRPAEVLAALTGYALPLEGVLDMHASMNYQFLGGGTRSVRTRVPKDLAQNFHFDGPQIAERALAEDVWTITFQKELTGPYALGITAQVPVAKQAGDDGDTAKSYSFAVKVPVISPLDVVRASGLWAVEANTETEIRFDATGMNEIDSLLAPRIPDYAPRHRVIGVFGWLGADYALTLNGVRHAAAAMLTAVVDALELNTIISTSGLHRHEAVYRLRASGVAYLDVALPHDAQLLSVAIDGVAVKPVADRPGSVRLPLPAKRDANTGVVASLVYETPGLAWKNRGTLALAAPAIAKEFPVLKSSWHVWVPDGFSFSEIESNLPVPDTQPEELLMRKLGRSAIRVIGAPFLPVFTSAQRRETAGVAMTEQTDRPAGAPMAGDEKAVSAARSEGVILQELKGPTSAALGAEAKALAGQAKQAFERNDFTAAVKLYDRALQVAPNNLYLLSNRGVTQFRIGKYKKAEEDLKKALSIVPEDAFCWSTLGIAYYSQEKYDEAVNALTKALAINPKNPTAHNYLGITAAQKGWIEASQKELEAAIQLDPNYADAWFNLSVTHTLKQPLNKVEARKAYAKAIELGADKDPAMESLIGQAGETKEFDRSKRDEKVSAPSSVQITRKLNTIIFPTIDFRDSTVREALEFVVSKSREFDPEQQGVNIVLKLGDEGGSSPAGVPKIPGLDPAPAIGGGSGTRITLTLSNVPLIEVIKYITNLANLKYKVEPFAVTIVPLGTATEELFIKEWKVPASLFRGSVESKTPVGGVAGTSNAKDFLAASGVTFGQGAFAMYSPVSGSLVVKGTQDQLDLVERIIEIASADASSPDAQRFGQSGRMAGLLPVTLDLPKSGRVLVFEGLYAPERLVMRYEDWWSRAKQLWLWFVGGGLAFYVFAGRQPWWRTLWAMLALSAVPLCVSGAWMPVCNALLGGWLLGLVLNRIAAWCVFRVRKEALA